MPAEGQGKGQPWRARLRRARRPLRTALLLVALGLLGWAVARRGPELADAMARLHPGAVAAAAVLLVAALVANMLSWREIVRGLGSELTVAQAAYVYLLGQLAKYLPGSVWALLAQVDLGRDHEVPAARGAAAAVLNLYVNLTTGVAVAVAGIGLSGDARFHEYWWLLLLLPVAVASLYPPVLRRLVGVGFRLIRRPGLDAPIGGRRLAGAIAWSVAMWVGFGLQVWVLALDLGASGGQLPLLGTGAYAAAWIAGFLVLVAPAGAGAREVVLTVTMTTVMPRSAALALALVARGLSVVGDLVTAVVGWVGGRVAARRLAASDR